MLYWYFDLEMFLSRGCWTYDTAHTPEVDAVIEGIVEEDLGSAVVEWDVEGAGTVVF